MSVADDAAPRHTLSYRVRNFTTDVDPPRAVEVHATPGQLRALDEDGFLVRERLVQGELLERLRAAADEVEASELARQTPGQGGGFGGLFVRNLLDRHPVFLETLLRFEPCLSVARAMLGPQVQVHATVLRVAYPELEGQGVQWHFHQRVVPEPVPAWFRGPVVVDNLIYLDDLTEDSGPLVVLPGSHRVHDRDILDGDHSDKPGQVVLTVPAGSCITSHSSLWHKALAPRPTGGKRRLLILGYSSVWQKQIDKPSAGAGRGLTDALVEGADPETRELLGLWGWY
jgi:ectoine hydroxylase-related dioxygenase (phytanoyl-CoA dioxygenase family)